MPGMTAEQREALLERIERRTEFALLVLSFIMIPLLVGPILWDLSPGEERTYVALDVLIWGIFALDIVIKTVISPSRVAYLRHHWLEVLPDSPPKIVGMAFVGLQQVWGVNRGVDRTLRGVSERIGNG